MRFLAIDLGNKRTGIAAGDDVTSLISPVEVIEMPLGDELRNALVKTIDRHAPDAVVIGLPLNMDGTEGPQAKAIRVFGDTLAERIEQSVHYQDERLTSHAAEQHLNRSGRTHGQKKKLRDALAAAEILRDFLDGRSIDRAQSDM